MRHLWDLGQEMPSKASKNSKKKLSQSFCTFWATTSLLVVRTHLLQTTCLSHASPCLRPLHSHQSGMNGSRNTLKISKQPPQAGKRPLGCKPFMSTPKSNP